MSTSLQKAAASGDCGALETALECSALNIDAVDANGRTALMIAAAAGHKSMVRALCAAGAEVTCTDGNGKNAKAIAEEGGQPECVAILAKESESREKIWEAILGRAGMAPPKKTTSKVPDGEDMMAKLLAEAGLSAGPKECPF